MIASAHAEPPRRISSARLAWLASVVVCGVFPAVTLVTLFLTASQEGVAAIDFGQFYRAAEKILQGETVYPVDGVEQVVWGGPYPYPPLPALLTVPLTVLPIEAARLVVMALLVVAAFATLHVLGVRDWRCYGVVLLWPPVLSAIQTGNITLFLGLGAALCWRLRDRPAPASIVLAVTLAAKLFLWPLIVWLAATRRYATALLASAIGAGLIVASWAVIGFDGILGYSERLRKLEEYLGDDAYTLHVLALEFGLPSIAARVVWIAVGLALLAAVVVLGRRGDERNSFALATVAALAVTPIVWLHYFALLLVVVALSRPRLGVVWFIPLAMVITPGSGHHTPFETAWTLGVAALTVSMALRPSGSPAAEPRAEVVRA